MIDGPVLVHEALAAGSTCGRCWWSPGGARGGRRPRPRGRGHRSTPWPRGAGQGRRHHHPAGRSPRWPAAPRWRSRWPWRRPPTGPLALVLVDVADPGNAGTLLRAAEASGAAAVLFCGASVDPCNPKCVRASAGALFHLPVAGGGDAVSVLEGLGEAGVRAGGHRRPRRRAVPPGRPHGARRRGARQRGPRPARSDLDRLVDLRVHDPDGRAVGVAQRGDGRRRCCASSPCASGSRPMTSLPIDALPDAVLVAALDGTLTAINGLAAELLVVDAGRGGRSLAGRGPRPPRPRGGARAAGRAGPPLDGEIDLTFTAGDGSDVAGRRHPAGGRRRGGAGPPPVRRAQRDRGHLHRLPRAAEPAHLGEGLHVADAQPLGPAEGRAEALDARAGAPRRRPRHPARHRAARHQPARDRPPRAAPPAGRPAGARRVRRREGRHGRRRPRLLGRASPPTSPASTPTPTRWSRCSPTSWRTRPSTAAPSSMEVVGRGRRRGGGDRRARHRGGHPGRRPAPGVHEVLPAGPRPSQRHRPRALDQPRPRGGARRRAHRDAPSLGHGSTFRVHPPDRAARRCRSRNRLARADRDRRGCARPCSTRSPASRRTPRPASPEPPRSTTCARSTPSCSARRAR